ncbi:hypothetical protein OROHE_026024 [Orobanche hederae]
MAELSIPTWPLKKRNTGHVHFASTPESYIDKLDDGIKQLALVKKLTLNEVAVLPEDWCPTSFKGNEAISLINLIDEKKCYSVNLIIPKNKKKGGEISLGGAGMTFVFQRTCASQKKKIKFDFEICIHILLIKEKKK